MKKNDSSNEFFISIKNSRFLLGCIWFKDVVNEDAFVWEWMRKGNKLFNFCSDVDFAQTNVLMTLLVQIRWAFWISEFEHFNSVIKSTSVNSLYETNCHSFLLYIRLGTFSKILWSYTCSSVMSLPILIFGWQFLACWFEKHYSPTIVWQIN